MYRYTYAHLLIECNYYRKQTQPSLQITAVKNEALDIAAVVAQYQREVAALKAQLAALSGERGRG